MSDSDRGVVQALSMRRVVRESVRRRILREWKRIGSGSRWLKIIENSRKRFTMVEAIREREEVSVLTLVKVEDYCNTKKPTHCITVRG